MTPRLKKPYFPPLPKPTGLVKIGQAKRDLQWSNKRLIQVTITGLNYLHVCECSPAFVLDQNVCFVLTNVVVFRETLYAPRSQRPMVGFVFHCGNWSV